MNQTGRCILTQPTLEIRVPTKRKQHTAPIPHLWEGAGGKYLGVSFSNDITWNHHINSVCKIQHTIPLPSWEVSFPFFYPTKIKNKCYNTLVIPQVEYARTISDLHTKKDMEIIETVHRRADRLRTNNHSDSHDWHAKVGKDSETRQPWCTGLSFR